MGTAASVLNDGIRIRRAVLVIRGQRVMLDADLAFLYRVPTRALIQAATRNSSRFPVDFMFRLTMQEAAILRSQIVISRLRRDWGGRRHAPYVFTEQGVAMLSSVLRSRRAIEVNIAIMRTFVRLRHMLISNEELAAKLKALEKKYDANFRVVFDAIRELMSPPPSRTPAIGFRPRPGGADDEPAGAVGPWRRRASRRGRRDVGRVPGRSKHAGNS